MAIRDDMTIHGGRWRASYSSNPGSTRGRLHHEPASPTRTAYQRDRDRVIHSNAFRRLAHKTQVFVHHEDDHYRTRLTHTIEVAQIARSIGRGLGLDEDLTEALALAHDLGHPPFGHAGESALDAEMADFGGFDHNAQSLRILTKLEQRYPEFDGLNLTWETLEGIAKHNGPLIGSSDTETRLPPEEGLPFAIREYSAVQDLDLGSHASLEAQAASLSDDIAYNAHDVEDGIRSGLITLEDLASVPVVERILFDIDMVHPGLSGSRLRNELVRRLITLLVEDAIANTRTQVAGSQIHTADDVRSAGKTLCAFSPETAIAESQLKDFLYSHLYRHPEVHEPAVQASRIVSSLFHAFMDDATRLPPSWQEGLRFQDRMDVSRRIADYIAGMTDRYAQTAYQGLFDLNGDLR